MAAAVAVGSAPVGDARRIPVDDRGGRQSPRQYLGRSLGALRHRPDAVIVVALLTVALALRLGLLYRAPVFLTGDSQSHFLPGYDLANGLGFNPELRRTPGYPLFVAGVIAWLGPDFRALVLAQHIVGCLTTLVTYWLGVQTYGRLVGVLAALSVAVNGALLISEHSVMTEALFGLLVLGSVALAVAGLRANRLALFVLSGVVLGLGSLTRPVGQVLLVAIPAVLVVAGGDRRVALRGAMGFFLGFVVAVGPWMARNFLEHGSLTASGGLGRSLVARTIKYDTGFFESDIEPSGPDDLNGQARQFVRGARNTIRNSRSVRSTQKGLMDRFRLTQAQTDNLMRQIAIDEISRRPLYYLVGSAQMAAQILVGKDKEDSLLEHWKDRSKNWAEQWEDRIDFLATPISGEEANEQSTAVLLTSIFQPAALGPILPLCALLGATLAVRRGSARLALIPSAAGLAILLASAALDGPVPRYRYPLDPLLALLAVGGLSAAGSGLIRRWRPVPA